MLFCPQELKTNVSLKLLIVPDQLLSVKAAEWGFCSQRNTVSSYPVGVMVVPHVVLLWRVIHQHFALGFLEHVGAVSEGKRTNKETFLRSDVCSFSSSGSFSRQLWILVPSPWDPPLWARLLQRGTRSWCRVFHSLAALRSVRFYAELDHLDLKQ